MEGSSRRFPIGNSMGRRDVLNGPLVAYSGQKFMRFRTGSVCVCVFIGRECRGTIMLAGLAR